MLHVSFSVFINIKLYSACFYHKIIQRMSIYKSNELRMFGAFAAMYVMNWWEDSVSIQVSLNYKINFWLFFELSMKVSYLQKSFFVIHIQSLTVYGRLVRGSLEPRLRWTSLNEWVTNVNLTKNNLQRATYCDKKSSKEPVNGLLKRRRCGWLADWWLVRVHGGWWRIMMKDDDNRNK